MFPILYKAGGTWWSWQGGVSLGETVAGGKDVSVAMGKLWLVAGRVLELTARFEALPAAGSGLNS